MERKTPNNLRQTPARDQYQAFRQTPDKDQYQAFLQEYQLLLQPPLKEQQAFLLHQYHAFLQQQYFASLHQPLGQQQPHGQPREPLQQHEFQPLIQQYCDDFVFATSEWVKPCLLGTVEGMLSLDSFGPDGDLRPELRTHEIGVPWGEPLKLLHEILKKSPQGHVLPLTQTVSRLCGDISDTRAAIQDLLAQQKEAGPFGKAETQHLVRAVNFFQFRLNKNLFLIQSLKTYSGPRSAVLDKVQLAHGLGRLQLSTPSRIHQFKARNVPGGYFKGIPISGDSLWGFVVALSDSLDRPHTGPGIPRGIGVFAMGHDGCQHLLFWMDLADVFALLTLVSGLLQSK